MNDMPAPDSPVGLASFRRLRQNGAHYVDRTRFLEEFINNWSIQATLITRPRRFGKTLLMDMVKEFFDMASDASDLFKGLYAEDLYRTHGHGMPVLPLSFAAISGDKNDIVMGIKEVLLDALENMGDATSSLGPLRQMELKSLVDSLNDDTGEYAPINLAIRFLTEILSTRFKQKVLLLIDEYDTPMQAAWVSGCYEELRPFLSNLYASALKDNPFVEKALLTGIQCMGTESIFSGSNNPSICTLADTRYADCFGFTEEETEAMLTRFGLSLTGEAKARYDGYCIGGVKIYNPWAIVNYCDRKRIMSFWSESGSASIIRDKMESASTEFLDAFQEIALKGKTKVHANMGHATFESADEPTLWGLLVNSGYLTFAPPEVPTGRMGDMALRIPNGDVADGFIQLLSNVLDYSMVAEMFRYLYRDRDTESFAREYQRIILQSTSFLDEGEETYRMFMLGMCICMGGLYGIKAEQEQGKGRSHVLMRSLSPSQVNIIMEFKCDGNADPDMLAETALAQIEDRMYSLVFKGETLHIGIGHRGKEAALRFAWTGKRNT